MWDSAYQKFELNPSLTLSLFYLKGSIGSKTTSLVKDMLNWLKLHDQQKSIWNCWKSKSEAFISEFLKSCSCNPSVEALESVRVSYQVAIS
jgi:phosphomevalonate kinase